MARIYDNWERLVKATLRREHLRLSSLRTPSDLSTASSSSSFSFRSVPRQALSFDFSISFLVGNAFTYTQIMKATDFFSDSNLIKKGPSGDLYYGVLEGGIQVVIKRIDLSSVNEEIYDGYLSELEFLNNVSHPRLVPLLGHCLEDMSEKFLVYKYMPKTDLSCYLYRENVSNNESNRQQFPPLDWTNRLKIAIGAAEGLYYLHHQCFPPMVHRDVKASSILLDDEFQVHIGSLSLACTAMGSRVEKENKIARFLGFPKAAGQGSCGKGGATCAHDVHCFGKILLQLVTGQLSLGAAIGLPDPNTPSIHDNGTKDHMCIPTSSINQTKHWKHLTQQIYDRELVRKILDPCLIVEENVFLEAWAVAIVGLACLHPKPSRRPQMSQVLTALKQGRINQSSYFEMTRAITSYKVFMGAISPRF